MRVALINTDISTSRCPPLGLLYIASVLEQDQHDVRVWDPKGETRKTVEELERFDPEVIGISILTPNVGWGKNIAGILKERVSGAVLVVGGVHATALPVETIQAFQADVVIVGEGEYTMRELCKRVEEGRSMRGLKGLCYRKGKRVVQNGGRELIPNLDELPFPARHLLDFEWYLKPTGKHSRIRGVFLERSTIMMTSRGCPYRCIYCGSHLVFGRRVRRRSIENSVDEIEHLINKYGIMGIWFVDDTFTVNTRWCVRFCKELLERRLDLTWGCQARVNVVSRELLREMKKAGCVQVDFGVESGSQRVLDSLKKDIRLDDVRKAFRIAKEVGLRRMASFMVGSPFETHDDILCTYRLAKELKPEYTQFFYATPFPGTELYDMAVSNGWIEAGSDFYGDLDVGSPLMKTEVPQAELVRIRENLQDSFRVRNYFTRLNDPSPSKIVLKTLDLLIDPSFLWPLMKKLQELKRQSTSDSQELTKSRI